MWNIFLIYETIILQQEFYLLPSAGWRCQQVFSNQTCTWRKVVTVRKSRSNCMCSLGFSGAFSPETSCLLEYSYLKTIHMNLVWELHVIPGARQNNRFLTVLQDTDPSGNWLDIHSNHIMNYVLKLHLKTSKLLWGWEYLQTHTLIY